MPGQGGFTVDAYLVVGYAVITALSREGLKTSILCLLRPLDAGTS